MSETSEILRTVLERLRWAQNQGLCWFTRLNAGSIFASYTNKAGKTKGRRIKLCPEGTPDVIVIQSGDGLGHSIVTFIETKAKDGVLSEAQKQCRQDVERQGCRYWLVKDADQLDALGLD